ncbi:3,4-dihydroxy-2-butanone-4-phosphate synthase [Candidatus Liberibacter africanus]|uniref:3,4-dihydroxy-2-butanone 4-phosphate synthase n=1 Tax=Candidatus Liberibacter africanus PTSAPSY TaxID=1277257 RepID=A0A0G3I277_LIBAF|nr:3,4-dihydroxy-2-butanone-4-phosphate synthase [Candidatus Liberibacter africanus]AKK19961.1 GTP cyclohydrolase II [Candidatus Liberibacter africanus PTSAPSY]QTP63797.1 3,4-dihydroxy-2-butanone-4-phosphate synthase [Candidatus Liberibacter africanus]
MIQETSLQEQNIVNAIQSFQKGEIVIITDETDRENEADLVLAATHCTSEKMAFIIRHTCGIVCTPMSSQNARKLRLNPMVSENESIHKTAFTVSVDSKHGITTGISSYDRTYTVKTLADPQSTADHFVRPGHIFPLISRDGGVLARPGHTEASIDLCKISGLPQVAVICELVNDDGTIKKGKQVVEFANKYKLNILSVRDLISWQKNKKH